MADVPLLDPLVVFRSETRHVGAGRLKTRERFSESVVVAVVIEIQLLAIVDHVVDTQGALMVPVPLAGHALVLAVSAIPQRHELVHQIESCRIEAWNGDLVARENASVIGSRCDGSP